VAEGADERKRDVTFDIARSFGQGEWAMTTAQTRVPSSLIVGLAGACALISIVVISILPH